MYTITKDFTFAAAHKLDGLPESHQCSRLHGHNYIVTIVLSHNSIDNVGFVMDYGELKPFGDWIDTHLDHRYLNEVLNFQTSAELLATHLCDIAVEVLNIPKNTILSMTVCETPKTSATYEYGMVKVNGLASTK
jgi:6-pyruvoyltetrahydropterin/6-carboxytetrahydropterin synthase